MFTLELLKWNIHFQFFHAVLQGLFFIYKVQSDVLKPTVVDPTLYQSDQNLVGTNLLLLKSMLKYLANPIVAIPTPTVCK